MKTVKQLLESGQKIKDERAIVEAYGTPHLSKADLARPQGFPRGDREAPMVIVLKRKAIRVYPDNQKVALYYSDQLDRYISVPFGPNAKSMGNSLTLNEKKEPKKPKPKSGNNSNRYLDPEIVKLSNDLAKKREAEKITQNVANSLGSDVVARSDILTNAKVKSLDQQRRNARSWEQKANLLGQKHKVKVSRWIGKKFGDVFDKYGYGPSDEPKKPVTAPEAPTPESSKSSTVKQMIDAREKEKSVPPPASAGKPESIKTVEPATTTPKRTRKKVVRKPFIPPPALAGPLPKKGPK